MRETVTYLSVGEVGAYGDRPLLRVLSKSGPVRSWVCPWGEDPAALVARRG
ncbi:MAG: hypothetical protein HC918_05555, partial [Oscillatoriales cyanobacterium SM2_1_8]|nr:hypothetical protein [Oscillatoriales cyanobacterium SM2_1_8]